MLKEAFQAEEKWYRSGAQIYVAKKSACFIVLQLLEGMNFVLFIRHHQGLAKCRHTIGPERLLEWVMNQYFGGFFSLGHIQTAQRQLWSTKFDLYLQTEVGDPTHPSPFIPPNLNLGTSIFILPHTTPSS